MACGIPNSPCHRNVLRKRGTRASLCTKRFSKQNKIQTLGVRLRLKLGTVLPLLVHDEARLVVKRAGVALIAHKLGQRWL